MPPYRASRSRSRSTRSYSLALAHSQEAGRRTIKEKVRALTERVGELEESAGRWKIRVRDLHVDVGMINEAMNALTASIAVVYAKTESLTHKLGFWASTLQAAWDAWYRNWAPEEEPDVELAT